MFELIACVVVYGLGMGVTMALTPLCIDGDLDGAEVALFLAWPISLPAIIALWATRQIIGGKDG